MQNAECKMQNEQEYVERGALLKDIEETVRFSVKSGEPSLEVRGAQAVIDRIKSAPAADVVEVRHGEWIPADSTKKGQKFICSVCKGVSYYPQPTRDKNWVKHCGYSHCPHCLAKMDGKGEG